MLYSVILGHDENVNNKWEVLKSGNDVQTTYLSNESIRQKIKLANKVTPKCKHNTSADHVESYDIHEKIRFVNNSKNMALISVNMFRPKDSDAEPEVSDSICYLTITNGFYKMMYYVLSDNVNIVKTYHDGMNTVGCALTFKYNGSTAKIITIVVENLVEQKFQTITLSVSENGKTIDIDESDITDQNELENLTNLSKNRDGFFPRFKIHFDRLVTLAYICFDKLNKDLNAAIEKSTIGEPIMITSTVKKLDVLDEEADQVFNDYLVKNNVKAITTVGVSISKDFCKKYGIHYLFDYNTKTGILKCIKSN